MQLWVLILAAVINLSLALVILTRVRNASSTAYFAISALFIALWAGGAVLMLHGTTEAWVYLGLLLFLLAPMATTLYMVLFSKHFAEVDYPRRYAGVLLYASAMVVGVLFVVPNLLASDIIVSIDPQGSNQINLQYPWFIVYGAYFSIMFVVAYAYLLIGVLRHTGRMREQLRYVLIGIFATSFLALVTNVLFPTFGNTDYLWLGPTWTIFYVIATSYAMIKHGLFDLRLALVLTFTYGLSLAALAAIYFTVAFAISAVLFNDTSMMGNNVVNVLIALLLAFLFQPIRHFFDRLTNKIFYQGTYNVDDFFASFSRALTSTTDLDQLLKNASMHLSMALKSTHVYFFIRLEEKRSMQVGTGRYAKYPEQDIRLLDSFVEKNGSAPIVLNLLDEDHQDIIKMLKSHKISIALPLVHRNHSLGYLFLGEHKKSSYSNRDLRVVTAIADELIIAIQNALSVHEVKDLNAHLEQRIAAATKELRASNAQLQRLDEVKDEFISMASHQLRTPLTSIKGYISMIVDGDVGKVSDQQKKMLEEAFKSSERMVRLINDFLNVSRLQTGKFIIEKRDTDLAKVVTQEIESLQQNAAAHNMKFAVTVPKKMPILSLDEGKIRQVIMNFADNAIYYSKEKSTIKVVLKVDKKDVWFSVTDTGIGVPKAEQVNLFGKFFRATNARRQRPDGTGVGLFLAKKVVTEHHGQVSFESTEGRGSTFGFRLPIGMLLPSSSSDTDQLNN